MWQEYLLARTVDEALSLLERRQGRARLVAGGTDLVIQCARDKCPAEALVDVTRIPELATMQERDGWVELGAAVTHAQAAESALVRRCGALLATACRAIGGPQIRNVGTLAGNLVTALPAADAALALVALDAEVEVATLRGRDWLPMRELHLGVGRCRVDSCSEVITRLRFRALGPEYRCAQERLARRKLHDLPILNVGAIAALRDGRLYDVRVVIGPVADKPLRVPECEAMLEGQVPEGDLLAHVAQVAASSCQPRDSLLRGSGEYRRALAAVMVRRALERVVTWEGN